MTDQPPMISKGVAMKKVFAYLCLCIIAFAAAFNVRAADTLTIYEADAWLENYKDVWKLPISRCAKLSEWNPQEGEPPLSLGKAAAIASKWVSSKNHPGDVESIEVRPVNRSESGKFTRVFFYAFTFSVAPYGNHKSCVVLMDGTVLEPEPHQQKPAAKK
jgi:hypothetical protein